MTKDYFTDPFAFAKTLYPTTVGFDSVFDNLETMHRAIVKNAPTYPPYNIKKVEENKYCVEFAVAGFGKQDIDIEINEGVLTIKGATTLDTATKDGVDVTYLHKGIADRSFARQFTLADTVEVKNAELFNGMLKIWLENIIPESKKPKKVDINTTADTTTSTSEYLAEKNGK